MLTSHSPNAIKRLAKLALRNWPRFGPAYLMAHYCRYRIEVVPGSAPPGPGVTTVLALNPDRFRGDLEILAQAGYRVLSLPFDVMARLYGLFYEPDDNPFRSDQRERLAHKREEHRKLLSRVLTPLYRWLKIDAVISAAVHYRQDYDWGITSQTVGAPYIVLHRENLAASAEWRKRVLDRMHAFHPFDGSHIIVHNQMTRDLLIESGYCTSGQISALGALRMDAFSPDCARNEARLAGDRKKRVTFFSFGPAVGIPEVLPPQWPANREDYLFRFCRDCHFAMFDFARDNPEVDVVIKPKWGGSWLDRIDEFVQERGFDRSTRPNLVVDAEIDAQELVRESDVVISFNSTTLLEAAVVGKPVILPLFAEAAEERWRDYVMFHDDRHAFEIADSREALGSAVSRLLANPIVPEELLEQRRALFEKYVAPLDRRALERYSAVIDNAAARSQG